MRILVTGASGSVGKNLLIGVPKVWQITAISRNAESMQEFCDTHNISNTTVVGLDLTSVADTRAALGEQRFDACVHLAANGDPRYAAEHPRGDIEGNILPLLTLLESGVKINKFIHFSSGSVYEGHSGATGPDTQLHTHTPYSISKQAAESYVQYFHKKGIISNFVIIRFFGCYGPYEAERKIYRRLVRAFAIDKVDSIQIYGDGSNNIYAMYASDAVKAILAVIQSETTNLTVDLCGPEALTIKEVVAYAQNVFHTKASIQFSGETPLENHKFSVSNKAFKESFGFEPAIKLDEGFRRYAVEMNRGE